MSVSIANIAFCHALCADKAVVPFAVEYKEIAFGTVSALVFTYFDSVVFFMIDSFELQFIVLVSFVYGKCQRPVFQLPFIKAAGEPLSVSLLRLSVTLGEKGDETVAVFLVMLRLQPPTAAMRRPSSVTAKLAVLNVCPPMLRSSSASQEPIWL